jgi:hypothetical protein
MGNAQCDITPLVARVPFSNHKHTWLAFKKFANFVRTEVPDFRNFSNSIMSLDVH